MTVWMTVVIVMAALALGFARFLGWFGRRGPLLTVRDLCPGLPDGPGFPRLEWLGHSSWRVEWGGRVLLLDPVLASRVSIAPRLCEAPGEACLAGVTDVLVSHAHMDHLDNGTLVRVPACDLYLPDRSQRFISGAVARRHRVRLFGAGDVLALGPLRVAVVPARHGGWRYPWQRGHFACGFVISDGRATLYYAGDTAWGPHFKEIGERHRPDIAILPVGGYAPRWFLRCRHLDPEEAARAAQALGARWVVPDHFGTYRVSLEPLGEPLARFHRAHPRPMQARSQPRNH